MLWHINQVPQIRFVGYQGIFENIRKLIQRMPSQAPYYTVMNQTKQCCLPDHPSIHESHFHSYMHPHRKSHRKFQKCLDIRRSGSAALDLCAIASGRAEIYFELILSPWDFAAGALIVEEAGGIVTTVEGEELPCLEKSSILARNK